MMQWPADQIERRSIRRLLPNARNARSHSDAQIAAIASSIVEWGWTVPILVDEAGVLIAGHARVLAAQRLNLPDVPVIVARGWSDVQKRAYMLADNKLALNAGWDAELLKVELSDLRALSADLTLIGFSEEEITDLLTEHSDGLTDPDAVPTPLAEIVSSTGDVWLLGRHRLACGDSTEAETLARATGGLAPVLMVTDPPYGVDYDPTWRNRAGVSKSKRVGRVANDHRADWHAAWALFKGDVAYVWHGALHAETVAASLANAGFAVRAQIIWAKDRLVLGRGDYHWQHEPCLYAVRGKSHWRGSRNQTTLWQIASGGQDAQTMHGTQKPVECMRRPMENNSVAGEAVYEPFAGSGTTIIAAEMCGRICCAVELYPAYIDLAVQRWQAFTGGLAILEATGASFADVARLRGVPIEEDDSGATR